MRVPSGSPCTKYRTRQEVALQDIPSQENIGLEAFRQGNNHQTYAFLSDMAI
jgi:hypothetical protein